MSHSKFIQGIKALRSSHIDCMVSLHTDDLHLLQSLVYSFGGSIALQTRKESGTDYQLVYQCSLSALRIHVRMVLGIDQFHMQLKAWDSKYLMFHEGTKLTIVDGWYFLTPANHAL